MPYKLKLRTLSPVHIGNGNKISDFEYFVHSNWYYKLNTDRCFNFVFDKVPNSMDKFNDWIEGKSDQISTYGQTKPKDSFNLNIFSFIKDYLRNTSLAEELKSKIVNGQEFYHYKMPVNITPKKEVAAALKTARNELYIPGTSIKGLIRTAIINQMLYEDKEKDKILQDILKHTSSIRYQDGKVAEIEKKKFYEDFESKIITSGYEYFDRGSQQANIKWGDAKYDFLKFLHVTDTNSIPCQDGGRLVEPNLFLPKKSVQTQVLYIETIKENVEFTARISIDMNFLKSLIKMGKSIKDEKGNKIWVGFSEQFFNVFGVDPDLASEGILLDKIKITLNNFSTSLENIDEQWLDKLNPKIVKSIIDFYDSLPEDSMKLGWGTGFPGMTVMTSLMEDDGVKKAYEASLKKLKIIKSDKSTIDEFPISKRLEKMGNGEPAPLGWVEFKFEKL